MQQITRIQGDEKMRQLAAIVESSDDAIIGKTLDGLITSWNQAAENIYGYSEAEALGQPIAFLSVPGHEDEIPQILERIRRGERIVHFETVRRRKDGQIIDVSLTVSPFRNARGEIVGASTIARDITARKQAERALEESAERFRILAEYTYDWEYWEGPDHTIWYVTPSCERITGFTQAEFLADPKLVHDIVHPEDRAVLQSHLADIAHEDLLGVDFRIVRKDGGVRWIAHGCRAVYWRDGRFMGRRVSNRDITERKQAEHALKRIEWLLTRRTEPANVPEARSYEPAYGDLTQLNTERLILDAVGKPLLTDIVRDFLDLLGTSAAVYEKNGDYALGLFSSGWCRFLDQASRERCSTADNREALACGRWHCHESCWTRAAKVSIQTGEPVDIECAGGIHLYAVPIRSGDEIIGSLNIGYGDPPRDPQKLRELAEQYGISAEELARQAESYESRPPFIIELAKTRLKTAARLIAEIVERKRAEEALRQRAEEVERLLDVVPAAVFVASDPACRSITGNRQANRLFEATPGENLSASTFPEARRYYAPDGRAVTADELPMQIAAATNQDVWNHEMVVRGGSGRALSLLGNAVPLRNERGEVRGCIGAFIDITDRKQAEMELRLANARFMRFVDSNIVGILIAAPGGGVIEANDYYLNLIGFTRQELEQGQVDWRAITPPEWLPADEKAIRELREKGVCTPYEKEYVRRDGRRIPVLLGYTMLPGRGEQIAAFCLDITERKAALAQIQQLAHHDELTGLPKRTLLQDRLEMALAAADRDHRRVALLFLDLDHFKTINDSLGHLIGDQVLQAVADRLKACLRRHDTLARTGGDEFIVVLPDLRTNEEAAQVAQKLRDALQAPFRSDDHDLYVTLSLGISLYPDDGADFDSLSRGADAALYRAKESGRDRYQFFTTELNVQANRRLQMENALRRALTQEAFELYYQPQWDMREERIIGLEALLRWHDPEQGWVAPAAFIPLAEKDHLILPIGTWALRTACRQNREWQEKGLPPVPVAVNISSLQISQAAFRQIVAEALTETQLQPQYLELELTESTFMERAETTIATVHALKAMGLRLAIDDFGTGYSSLIYLKRLPIDRLKIDRSFVRDINTDPNDVMIIHAIIGLAASLQLEVIAEGVETQGQRDFLRAAQCPKAQGYYFSKPMPAHEVEALLRKKACG